MKDCFFFLSSMPFSQRFSPRDTTKRLTPPFQLHSPLPTSLLPKNNHNKTKQKIRQVTDQKRVFKGQASFFGSCFSSGWLQLCFRLYWKLNKTLFPDKTCTLNINDRNWLSKPAGAILKIPTRFSTHLFKLPLNLTSRERSRREL